MYIYIYAYLFTRRWSPTCDPHVFVPLDIEMVFGTFALLLHARSLTANSRLQRTVHVETIFISVSLLRRGAFEKRGPKQLTASCS